MTTRNGKIARLPFEIREEINNRLFENEPAKTIVTWLNTDSTVIPVLQTLFEGRHVTEQNISEWRQGGYQEWLTLRSCLENVRDLSENAARIALTGVNAEHLLMVITATYSELLQKWEAIPEITFNRKLIVLKDLANTALAMRRSEQRDARLQLDRERVEILREKRGDKSPSSLSQSSCVSAHASTGSAFYPKAPKLRRPPSPQREEEYFVDAEFVPPEEVIHPNPSGPDLQNRPIASAAVPVSGDRSPTPVGCHEPAAPRAQPSDPQSSNVPSEIQTRKSSPI